jgi:hypothetical protein
VTIQNSTDTERRPPVRDRSPHSEAYWQVMKYLILGLAALMILALALAVIILLKAML